MLAFFFDYENDEHNEQFEDFIRRWEDIHFKQEHECAHVNMPNAPPYVSKFHNRTSKEMNDLWGDPEIWPGDADYDVYGLLPTIYYYGYRGSITTPPCSDNVVWRFLDLPMQINHDQFLRIQRIVLDQKDKNCNRSSKAYKGGINRPLQINSKRVFHCSADKWKAKFPELWCGKWPESYHGNFRLEGVC